MNAHTVQARIVAQARIDHGITPVRKELLRLRLYCSILTIDAACIVFGLAIGNTIRFGNPLHVQGMTLLAVLLPVYAAIALNSRAYASQVLIDWAFGAGRALMSLAAAILAIMFVSFYLRSSAEMSRMLLAIGTAATGVGIVGARALFHRQAVKLYGASPLSEIVIRDRVECESIPGARILDAQLLDLKPDAGDPLMLDRLGTYLRHADRVVVSCPSDRRAAWTMALKGANVRAELLMPELGALGPLSAGRYGGQSTIVVAVGPLGLRSRLLKRLLDLSISSVATLALAPLLILTAIAIRIEGDGPILFRQQRLGRGNRLFMMYKFRSMRVADCDAAGNQSTRRDDDRITRVGRIIRATSIDELPQILNVLKGDMSFVGPRPHALGSTAGEQLFWEVDQRYWHRHASKPGLTGLAQVRGFRGATHQKSDLVNRLQADLEYLNGWTIWRDIGILFATFRVLVHRNAY